MISHPALISVNIAEREREAARRRLVRQASVARRGRRAGRRRRLRDLLRRPRPAVSGALRPSAPWRA